MTRSFNLAAAAAMAAAALISLAALSTSSKAGEKEGLSSCAAALCGIVIF